MSNTSENSPQVSQADLDAVAAQLGREPRGVIEIAYRSPDGQPGVVKTAPKLPDGTPFPTLYYLTDPRLTAEASRQESAGVMREMTERLTQDPELAAAYRRAYESYLAERGRDRISGNRLCRRWDAGSCQVPARADGTFACQGTRRQSAR